MRMRPTLHLIADRRDRARNGTRLRDRSTRRRTQTPTASAGACEPKDAKLDPPVIHELSVDLAARRVREAGGPTDRASYTCQCGYTFTAAVSTSVCCPNCGAEQAW
jgi:hypothetical protein